MENLFGICNEALKQEAVSLALKREYMVHFKQRVIDCLHKVAQNHGDKLAVASSM